MLEALQNFPWIADNDVILNAIRTYPFLAKKEKALQLLLE